MNRKKIMLLIIPAIIILIVSGCFCFFVLTHFCQTASPDQKHLTSYNLFNRVVTTKHTQTDTQTLELLSNCAPWQSPRFSWSPNSRYLAISYTDADHCRRIHMADFVDHKSFSVRENDLLSACGRATPIEGCISLHFVEWLDNCHALIKFSWNNDKSSNTVSGWFTWQVATGQILELHTGAA